MYWTIIAVKNIVVPTQNASTKKKLLGQTDDKLETSQRQAKAEAGVGTQPTTRPRQAQTQASDRPQTHPGHIT